MNIKHELERSLPASIKLSEKEKANIRTKIQKSHQPKYHVKPLIVSIVAAILIGISLLPIIQSVEKASPPLNDTSMSITDEGQQQNIEPSAQSVEETPKEPLSLTDEEKRQYYEQYLEIIDRAMQKKTGLSFGVVPIEEYKDEYWITPQQFENDVQSWLEEHLATEREKIDNMLITPEPVITNADGSTTKTTYIYFPDILKTIEVTGHFETQYNEIYDRQLFIKADNISTKLAYPRGTWEQTSYRVSLIDGGRTYSIRIEGNFDYNGLHFEKAFTIEFNCDVSGKIY
ncbi:hypothetical protein [Lysinibacillus pakistanensis]|uniref:DUF4367 domain-containing protein n=1 Tax=Lysinibacillus pakistanensis TaxID=759811 RepID=A0ABX6DFE9_9BACI|nr:hypothetical protein GDS87_22975 [Lysinibacillus pakistanensis]